MKKRIHYYRQERLQRYSVPVVDADDFSAEGDFVLYYW
jgi:hypothetical protein